jgi:replicative DNA helicase
MTSGYVPSGKPPIDPYAPLPPKVLNGAPPANDARKAAPRLNDWGEPEPFDSVNLPPFPVEALPPWMRDWVEAEALTCQVPADLPAALALTCASLAVARRYHVQIREGWTETANLWTVIALPPGERKSPVFVHAVAPIHRYVAERTAELAPRIRDRAIERHILSGQLDAARGAAVKGKPYDGGDAKQAARELACLLDDLPEIHPPSLLADDITPEALAIVLAQNDERIGIFSAEGGPLEVMAGRYTEKGTNFEIFLKAHSGDTHIVNRVKREPVHLSEPILTMALTVQPIVIEGLSTKPGFRGRGLLARFLYSMPRSRVGSRAENPPTMPEKVSGQYDEALFEMLRGDVEHQEIIALSPGADAARAKFQREIEPRLGLDGDLNAIADWGAKLTGAVCRVAAVLQVAEGRDTSMIDGETFAKAVRIGTYFLAHAVAAFQVMGDDEATELAKRVWGWIRRKGRTEFSERDVCHELRVKIDAVGPALLILVGRNLVRERSRPPSAPGRPASPMYDVYPTAVAS